MMFDSPRISDFSTWRCSAAVQSASAPAAASSRSSGGRSPTSTVWPGAITVSQWQTFSSWRTLPCQSCATR